MSKDDTVKKKELFSISKDKIIKKYIKMDKYFRDVIEGLYAEKYKSFDLENIIKESKDNDYNELNFLKDKTGCYIFKSRNRKPVYIGVGGVGGLGDRIAQECRAYVKKGSTCKYSQDSGATLSQNIQEIDGLSAEESVEKIKKFQLIAIIVGERDKRCDRYKAQALEAILIALFHPKYTSSQL